MVYLDEKYYWLVIIILIIFIVLMFLFSGRQTSTPKYTENWKDKIMRMFFKKLCELNSLLHDKIYLENDCPSKFQAEIDSVMSDTAEYFSIAYGASSRGEMLLSLRELEKGNVNSLLEVMSKWNKNVDSAKIKLVLEKYSRSLLERIEWARKKNCFAFLAAMHDSYDSLYELESIYL